MDDRTEYIIDKIKNAYSQKRAVNIRAGNTKHFYGRTIESEPLSLADHSGILEYEPSELYITARCGTSLAEIEKAISEKNQIFPFEPPHFGSTATIGGAIASGLSGCRRASGGSIRESILGTEVINGKGELLRFGGKVMKNVAGYDVSRLMCGALGTLGIIMSASVRLSPKPACEETLVLALDQQNAIKSMNKWSNTPIPISATFYDGENLYIRLSSSSSAIKACKKEISGETFNQGEDLWKSVKEHTHSFFQSDKPLWRISVPPSTERLNISEDPVLEWNGALRWYTSEDNINSIRSAVEQVGGHATLFKGDCTENRFHPLSDASMNIHKKLKNILDPEHILNPGKMFADF